MAKTLLIIVGVLSAIAGIYALMNPLPATLAATVIAGWAFLIYGILHIFAVFSATGWGGRIWAVLLGVLGVIIGIEILANPLESVITLTLAVGIMFLASGIAKVIMGFTLQVPQFRWAIVLSGVVSVILGVMIFSNFPQSAAVVLGILLGVELLSNGVASIAIAMSGAVNKA